jgi:hypothetical protein
MTQARRESGRLASDDGCRADTFTAFLAGGRKGPGKPPEYEAYCRGNTPVLAASRFDLRRYHVTFGMEVDRSIPPRRPGLAAAASAMVLANALKIAAPCGRIRAASSALPWRRLVQVGLMPVGLMPVTAGLIIAGAASLIGTPSGWATVSITVFATILFLCTRLPPRIFPQQPQIPLIRQ